MTILNGLVPGSLVYFESFVLAFMSVAIDKYNAKHEIPKEEIFEKIYDDIPGPVVKYDIHGYPLVWNKKMEEETGYTKQEIREFYYNEKKRLASFKEEWPFIIMHRLYNGENLDKVVRYLSLVMQKPDTQSI